MKRLIALAVVIFASQAVATFGGGPVGSSTQVTPPPSFFRPNEFDAGAFGTFVTGLGSGANASVSSLAETLSISSGQDSFTILHKRLCGST